jgi:hypothetical protein
MSKKPINFVAAMQTFESREGVQRRLKPALVAPSTPPEAKPSEPVSATPSRTVQRSRVGKVSIGVWVDPAVRKQLAQIALDTDQDQSDLLAEGLNLMFERYGKPPIAQS